MSDFANLSPAAQELRNELLLLLLDLRHKKDSILLSPAGEYQRNLCNDMSSNLVSPLFPVSYLLLVYSVRVKSCLYWSAWKTISRFLPTGPCRKWRIFVDGWSLYPKYFKLASSPSLHSKFVRPLPILPTSIRLEFWLATNRLTKKKRLRFLKLFPPNLPFLTLRLLFLCDPFVLLGIKLERTTISEIRLVLPTPWPTPLPIWRFELNGLFGLRRYWKRLEGRTRWNFLIKCVRPRAFLVASFTFFCLVRSLCKQEYCLSSPRRRHRSGMPGLYLQ